MTEDELIREIQLKQQLSELDGSQVSEYDPSDGMETVEELKKYVRFLYASLQEKDRENLQMKKDMAEIKDNLKSANRRADEEAASRKRLFDKLERFMDEQKSESDKYKELERKFETLQGRYDLDLDDDNHEFLIINTIMPSSVISDGSILDYIMEDQFIDEDIMDQESLDLIMILNGTMSFHRSRRIEKKEPQGIIEFL